MSCWKFFTFIILVLSFPFFWGNNALAQTPPSTLQDFTEIDQGYRIFTEETFAGNGRTCASCHIPRNNYSISPKDVEKLSKEEFSSLSVPTVPGLEHAALLKDFAVFNEGAGDTTDLNPVLKMQSSPRIDGLALNIKDQFEPDRDQLGWNGHGSANAPFPCEIAPGVPADGNVISFAMGAVRQHFTNSLDRIPEIDFRCPSEAENLALESFQLWIGRRAAEVDQNDNIIQTEYPLNGNDGIPGLVFNSPKLEEGKRLFLTREAGCNGCHRNAGALDRFGNNAEFDTGVEAAERERRNYSNSAGFELPENFGDGTGRFNTTPIIGSVASGRFFHNNLETDFEKAIGFYFTPHFVDSPSASSRQCGKTDSINGTTPPVPLPADPKACLAAVLDFHRGNPEGTATFNEARNLIGGFLRALDAWYELKDCERLIMEVGQRIQVGANIDLPILHCTFNLQDVKVALEGSKMKPNPYRKVLNAARQLQQELKAYQKTFHIFTAHQNAAPFSLSRFKNGTPVGRISQNLIWNYNGWQGPGIQLARILAKLRVLSDSIATLQPATGP
jgi:hypothetical protein